MTIRIEDKIDIHKSKLLIFKKWILQNKGKKLYSKRKISSIYFDTKNFQMHQDSEEGCTPRMKLRIRYYDDKNFYLEKKISTQDNKSKITKKININKKDNLLKKGIFDSKYGLCYPRIIISYMREYYSISSLRITIDTNIQYQLFNSKKIKREKSVVVEVKSNNILQKDHINNLFYFPRIRFSKYCRGISSFYF
jgi:hypothetical protein